MRLLDRLFRRIRRRDRQLEAALIAQRFKDQKRGIRAQRDAEDYPSRGSGWVGR
jgi:hypothetical protein